MTARTRALIWIFALLGLTASSASAWVHHQLLRDPRYTSFCDVNDTVSCTEAYLSPWGSLFGVPVALFGMLFFVAVLGLLVAERRAAPAVRENVPAYVFAMSVVGLGFVLYLAYGAFFVLGAVCLLCILTYLAVIGLFLLTGRPGSTPMSSLPSRALRDLRTAAGSPLALALIVVFVVGAVSAIAFFPREGARGEASAGGDGSAQGAPAAQLSAEERAQVQQWFDAQQRQIVPVDPKGASVLIVKFHDFQCPPCRQAHFDYKPILARWEKEAPGQVRMVTRDFPIHPACNAATPAGTHRLACDAAVAVRLAREHGKEAAVEDWIYSNQATLTADSIRRAAREVGGVTDFDARYPKVIEDVKADAAMGALMQVRATPTFFINGVKIDGGMPPKYFDAVVEYELKKRAK
jgi:uncharacterized membrane protein/protein-disulfide isomerase